MSYMQEIDKGKHDFTFTRETAVKDVARQLLRAVGYMHKKGIIHSNICPENILV
jgi:serine/threonine protein kinase